MIYPVKVLKNHLLLSIHFGDRKIKRNNIFPVRNSDNLGISEQIFPMHASHKLPYSRISVETSNRTWKLVLWYWFFDFSTFRTLRRRYTWSILVTMLIFLDFSTFRRHKRSYKWLILLNPLIFFDFSTSWEDV